MMPTIQLGAASISSYNLMTVAGALGMLLCVWFRRRRFHLTRLQSIFFALLIVVFGVIGAKVLYVLESLPDSLKNGISLGGSSFFGAVFMVPLMMPLFAKVFRLTSCVVTDICAPCGAVMVGTMRFGCFLAGCCGGWIVYIGDYYFPWPTQIIESIGDFIILACLLRIEKKGCPQGALYPLFMLSYGILRFFVEFLRYSSNKWIHLAHGHWFSLASILIAILWLRRLKKR